MRDWIALNMTPGVGPRAAARLLERFGSAEGVFGALRSELERLRLRPEAVESIALRDRHEEFHALERERGEAVRAEGDERLLLDDAVAEILEPRSERFRHEPHAPRVRVLVRADEEVVRQPGARRGGHGRRRVLRHAGRGGGLLIPTPRETVLFPVSG